MKTVVRREADVKMQKIAKRFHKRGQDMYHQSIMTELQQEKERVRRLEERRTKDIEKVKRKPSLFSRKQNIQTCVYQLLNQNKRLFLTGDSVTVYVFTCWV